MDLLVSRSTDYIFQNNREWAEECLVRDPDTFKKLAKSQKPRYMYIGCSDSRVPAQNMMVSLQSRWLWWVVMESTA